VNGAARAWLFAGAGLLVAWPHAARAQVSEVGHDGLLLQGIDDPKVARRLGTTLPTATDPTATATAAAAEGPPTIVSEKPPAVEPAPNREPSVPRVGLAFRRFSFVRVGATMPGSTSGTAASEPFNSLSLDLYPLSTVVRFGLSSQYGWQSGAFGGSGDYFLAESFTLGGQGPIMFGRGAPFRQLTLFGEGYAGGGYMRRLQFDTTIPTVYWQFGVDAGADLFFAQHGFLSLAFGYLHPVNGFATTKMTSGIVTSAAFTTVFVDTWSFKVGIGF
jgi:hypothetical protein